MTDVSNAPEGDVTPVSDDASAIAAVNQMLAPEEGTSPQEAAPSDDKPTEEVVEASDEARTEETPADEAVEPPSPEEEGVELPDTIEGLAEHLGVDANDLSGHITFTIDGEETTLAELKDGYLRRADYSRKTAESADERKALEAERGRLEGHLTQRLQHTDNLVALLEQQLPLGHSPGDLDALMETDPVEYLRVKARTEAQTLALQQAYQARQQNMAQEQQAGSDRQAQYRADQQAALVREIPDLADPEKAVAFERDVGTYLERMSFSPEEVSGFFNGGWDHRQIKILQDAANYSKFKDGEKTLKKKLKSLPKVQKPGTATDKRSREADAKSDVRTRMNQRGDDKSAQAYIKSLLD